MDSSRNWEEPKIESSEELNLNSFKNNLAVGLPTLNKTLELNHKVPLLQPIDLKESLLLPAKSLNTLVNKKLNYVMVSDEEVELKKKIFGNIGE